MVATIHTPAVGAFSAAGTQPERAEAGASMKAKQPQRGDRVRRTITVLKMKNGLPTVIQMSGQTYVLQSKDTYHRPKS